MVNGDVSMRNLGSAWVSLARNIWKIETEAFSSVFVQVARQIGMQAPPKEVIWHISQ